LGKGLGWLIVWRKAFTAGKHLVGEAVEDGGSGGVSAYGRALKDKGSTGLGEGPGSEDEERAACAIGSLTETEPGGKRDAVAVLGRSGGEIEHEGGEAAGLEEEIGGAQGLVESLEAWGNGVGAE
jgi:hypothetical protein